jgi:hypothetical protein
MNNFRRNLFAFFGIALALSIVLFWIFLRTERISYYKSAIPEKLEVNRVVLEGDDWSFMWGKSCGGAVFKLSKSTINAIESKGLDFFDDATQPRKRKYTYPAWKKTPVPYTWTSEGAWTGLACISKSNTSRLIRKITKTSELPGSYYTDLDSYRVVVLPELDFVTFTYTD